MNTTHVKLSPTVLLAFVLLPYNLSAIARPQEKIRKKEISQSYGVSAGDHLQVENRYGNITVTHWNQNTVAMRAEVECKARNEERIQKNLDRIRTETKKIDDIVSAVTTMKKEMNSNSNNESTMINYYIQMPPEFAADSNQKYGNINSPSDNDDNTNIHVKYGNLNAGNFTANAMIEARYGNIEVGDLQDAQLDLGYVGTAKIRSAKDLTINSKYSNLDVQDIQSLRMEIKYGNLTIESVSRLDMEIKYSDVKIRALKDTLNVSSLSHSSLKMRNLSHSFSKMNVESYHGNLEVALPAKTPFWIIAENMRYSDCDVSSFNITCKHFDDEDRDKNYTYEINGGKQPTIHLEGNRYGNLKVKVN